jgi:hypothetical protein
MRDDACRTDVLTVHLLQTTNMLLECGELALRSPTDTIPNLKPLR